MIMTMQTAAGKTLFPEVQAFLSKEVHGAVIGGQEVTASNGDTFDTRDPGTGEKLATVSNMQPDDVERSRCRRPKGIRRSRLGAPAGE